MTDCELLEFAAKAAGVPIDLAFGLGNWVGPVSGNRFFSKWNPLTDDGDALRLAVKLRIDVQFCKNMGGEFVEVMAHPVGRGDCMGMAEIGEDDLAATRRAIVRAAAEIGKEQQ